MPVGDFGGGKGIGLGFDFKAGVPNHADNLGNHVPRIPHFANINVDLKIVF